MAKTKWYRRPWVAPFAFVVVAFVAFSLPPYLTLDPADSRVQQPGDYAWYFPALVAHVIFGSVAILTCVLQVWPWFRQRHPVAHRRLGRVYVFGGVLPGGVLAVAIGTVSPFGPLNQTGTVLMGSLWLTFTVVGYRMARQKRFADHRRWMIRSFALTASIMSNRIWGTVASITLIPRLDTTFGGSTIAMTQAIAGFAAWFGWVVPALIAEWWLVERGGARKRRAPVSSAEREPVGV